MYEFADPDNDTNIIYDTSDVIIGNVTEKRKSKFGLFNGNRGSITSRIKSEELPSNLIIKKISGEILGK